jgi:signal transduction histidine kinase/ActR/RegA family two-component response regulator
MPLGREDDRALADERSHVEPLLRWFVYGVVPITLAWATALSFAAPHAALRTWLYAGLVSALGAGSLLCLRKGRVELAVRAMSLVLWLVVAFAAFTSGGVRGVSFSAFGAIVLMTGVLWSSRAALAMALLSAAWGGALVWLDAHGLLPASIAVEAPIGRWLASCLVFGAIATLQHLWSRALRANLMRARDENLQRRRSEEAGQATMRELEQSERRYRNIFDSAAVALFEADLSALAAWRAELGPQLSLRERWAAQPELLDAVGERIAILDANEAALRLIDLDRKAALLGPVGRRFRPADFKDVVEFALALLESSEPVQREVTLFTFTGREKRVLITGRGPHDATGRVGRLVVSVVDVTEQRRLEARSRAAQRLEAIGRLAGGVAHDFNNALVVIISWASMLRRPGRSEAERMQGLDAISKSAGRAAELTRQLLSIGRRRVHEPKPSRIDAIVDDTVQAVERILPADVQVRVTARCDVPAMVDEAQLQQVLLNLTLNARDAMPQGGRLELRTRVAEPHEVADLGPGSYVVISVRDTGVGMDTATQERLFEPFFTTKSEQGGTGLGLATAHAIVLESRGKISVDTKLGEGTEFRVYLPAASASAPPAAIAPHAHAGGGRTVLLVEDDPMVCNVVTQTLRDAGYHVQAAGDGAAALVLARQLHAERRPIDVLCTDAILPGMPVRELIDRVLELFPDVPVLVCSGHVREDLLRRGIERGEWSFLAKPFTPDELLRKLEELLGAMTREAIRAQV